MAHDDSGRRARVQMAIRAVVSLSQAQPSMLRTAGIMHRHQATFVALMEVWLAIVDLCKRQLHDRVVVPPPHIQDACLSLSTTIELAINAHGVARVDTSPSTIHACGELVEQVQRHVAAWHRALVAAQTGGTTEVPWDAFAATLVELHNVATATPTRAKEPQTDDMVDVIAIGVSLRVVLFTLAFLCAPRPQPPLQPSISAALLRTEAIATKGGFGGPAWSVNEALAMKALLGYEERQPWAARFARARLVMRRTWRFMSRPRAVLSIIGILGPFIVPALSAQPGRFWEVAALVCSIVLAHLPVIGFGVDVASAVVAKPL